MIIAKRKSVLGLEILEGRLEKDGEVIAWMAWSVGPPFIVRNLLVAEEYRGKGYGRELIEMLDGILIEAGVPRDFENLTIGSNIATAPGLTGLVVPETRDFAMKMAEEFSK